MQPVQKITKRDKLYGPVHLTDDGNYTLCGAMLSGEQWYILREGEVTCKECRKEENGNSDV